MRHGERPVSYFRRLFRGESFAGYRTDTAKLEEFDRVVDVTNSWPDYVTMKNCKKTIKYLLEIT